MTNIPRLLFYISGLLFLSAAFIIFTSELLPKVNDGTTTGTVLFFIFGLVYMGMVSQSSKRYMRRLQGPTIVPFIFGPVVFISPAAWAFIYKGGEATSPILFVSMLAIACGTGAWFGHKMGLKAQIKFQKDLQTYLEREERLSNPPQDNQN